MVYGSTTVYAIRGLSALALRPPGERVMLEDLIQGTDLPRDFLAKIFQRLVHHGLLNSARGRRGGFALARPAYQISILDILQALEGEMAMDRCVVGLSACNDHMPCPQHDLYKPIRQRLKDYLSTTTLADLAASLRTKTADPAAKTESLLPPAAMPDAL
jgi:Rrf2 family protein